MRSVLVFAVVAVVACGSGAEGAPSGAATSTAPAASPPAPPPAPPGGDPPSPPGADGGSDAGVASTKTYRSSLSVCWTDATCNRAMIVAHGGDWSASGPPYGSMSAVVAAYTHGAEAVKIDVRVTADNVPVVSHSSPFQIYESLDCYGKKIEEMTAAQVTACHFATSTSETFQRLDTMLAYASGKLVVQLCVKKTTDYARTVAEVLALGAQDFAFLEINTPDLALLPAITGSNQVFYLVNVGSTMTDIDTILAAKNPRAFMIEMDPTAPGIGAAVSTKIHPAGVRAFSYDSSGTASVAELKALFDEGIDVVSSNVTSNDLQARVAANTARGITPP